MKGGKGRGEMRGIDGERAGWEKGGDGDGR